MRKNPAPALLRGVTLVGGGLACLGAAAGAGLAFAGRRWVQPARVPQAAPSRVGLTPEDVSFLSDDGTLLKGWMLSQPGASAPALVICHGFQRCSDETQRLGMDLHELGYQVLLFDFRACGRSEGEFTTIGYYEVADLVGAIAFLEARLPARTPVGVLGLSMGAAVAIMGAARSARIDAVVADSPFATLAGAMDFRLELEPNRLSSFAQRISIRFAERFVKVRVTQVRPIDHVAQIAPRPLLLIHGTNDEVIASADSVALFGQALQPKELWMVEGSSHCAVRFDRPREYLARVDGFFRAAFSRRAPATTTA